MEWLIWLLIWILAALPLPTGLKLLGQHRRRGKKSGDDDSDRRYRDYDYHDTDMGSVVAAFLVRLLFSIVIAAFAIIGNTQDSVMTWYILFYLGFSYGIEAFLVESHTAIKVLTVALMVILVISAFIVGVYATYNNANAFNGYITQESGFPIQHNIPDNLVRLVTASLALSITHQHLSDFGSNVNVVDQQITMYHGRLVWVQVIARQEGWGLTYKTAGLVIVDANDPNTAPVILQNVTFAVSGGLDFNPIVGANGNAGAVGYYSIGTQHIYGDCYPVFVNDTWYMALNAMDIGMNFANTYGGTYLFNQAGQMVHYYAPEKAMPSWLVQTYPESAFLNAGINDWGSDRQGSGFNLWAGGFLWMPPSQDRVQMSEQVRYIYDPDLNEVVGYAQVNPVRSNGNYSLAGIFRISPQGIGYYNLENQNFVSGSAASKAIKQQLTNRVVQLYSAMELLYPMTFSQGGQNVTKYVYYIPIYSQSSGLVNLAGLAMADALNPNQYDAYVPLQNGMTGAQLVASAKAQLIALYGGSSTQPTPVSNLKTINGTVSTIYTPYDRSGSTYQWISIRTANGTTVNVLANYSALSDQAVLALQQKSVGSAISVQVDTATMQITEVLG